MNKVILIGNLTEKPQVKYTSSNKPYCKFTLAVQRNYKNQSGEYGTDFLNCEIWDKQAENLCKYQEKGNKVAIEGRIQVTKYEVEGIMKYATNIVCTNIEFLSSKKKEQVEEVKQETKDPFAEFGEQISISDDLLD